MKIVCDGLDLSDAVLKVSKGISSKTTNPILEGIKIVAEEDYLTLTATDLEIEIEKKIKSNVMIEGECVVPGKFFSEYIRKLNQEQIELNLSSDDVLTIKYTDSVGKIQCLNSEEFPLMKQENFKEYFEITKKSFKTIINKVIISVLQDDSRPILKGCLLTIEDNKLKGVSLDGFRMSYVEEPIITSNLSHDIIIPAKSISEIGKLLDDSDDVIKVYVQKNFLMVEIDNTKITTRLMDGEFLNYKSIIQESFQTDVVVNKEILLDALDRASLLSRADKSNFVKFDIKDKVMVLSTKSELGDIKENITISLTGEDLQAGFNSKYFIDALRVIDDEFVKIRFNNAATPCVIVPTENTNYLFLILPLRVIS